MTVPAFRTKATTARCSFDVQNCPPPPFVLPPPSAVIAGKWKTHVYGMWRILVSYFLQSPKLFGSERATGVNHRRTVVIWKLLFFLRFW
ncbi:hypothetical protein [Mesorhizobium sp. 1B3]|uniref:hypothetical protein n=1 Tax=Mesorhizobium sp. 1B3 TaxID=3243599 RepID=UPI003D958DAB